MNQYQHYYQHYAGGSCGGNGGGGGGGSMSSYPYNTIVKEKTLFQEIKNDVTGFIREHRGVIYFIALALLIDHFIFKGVFKTRLQAMLESLIAKVENKVSAAS
jgi:hypothetical protein